MGKTKVLRSQVSSGEVEESGEYPCGVCRQGVGTDSIKCTGFWSGFIMRCCGVVGLGRLQVAGRLQVIYFCSFDYQWTKVNG